MGQVVKPLWHHRLMPLLVVLQVAIACAIASNALFLLQQRLTPILAAQGVGHPDRLLMVTTIARHGGPWPPSQVLAVRASLLAIPGVDAVSAAAALPMDTHSQLTLGLRTTKKGGHKANASMYIGNYLVDTLDLKLVSGRDFSTIEQGARYGGIGALKSAPVIITRDLANHLFPDGHAVGKVMLDGSGSSSAQYTVVGIVANLMRNMLDPNDSSAIGNSVLIPGILAGWPLANYAVRIKPGADVGKVRKSVKTTIQREMGPDMVRGLNPNYNMYSELRHQMLAKPRAAVWLLSGVSLIVLIVAVVGIMGLTSYWVQQRTREIGIRRALGARRRDILRHIQLENLLVVGVGVAFGLIAAYGINFWLMQHFELARLPWTYLPMGAALLLVLGQLAVLKPALSAARVPPVVATRSV